MERLLRPVRNLYTGRWMKLYELRAVLKKKPWWFSKHWLKWLGWFWSYHTGFCVNGKLHLSEKMSCTNYMIFGKTGSGKSTCSIIPTLLLMDEHSLVVTDPGELWEVSSGTLEKRGYRLLNLNIADAKCSDTYNPMDFITERSEIRKAVELLIRSAFPDNAGNNAFWNKSTLSILVPLWVALVKQPEPRYRNVANLRMLLLEFGNDGKRLDALIGTYCDEESFKEYKSFLSQDPKVIQNILSTAKSALSIFADPNIQRLTASTSIDLALLRKEKTALFLKIPEGDIESYQYIIAILYDSIFKQLMKTPEKSDRSVFCVLDEFANCGITLLPQLPSIVTQVRKKRVGLCMCLQDKGQLEGTLGMAATSTIVEGGTFTKLYLPGMSLETARYLESLLGMTNKTYIDHLGNEQEQTRSVMTADEIKTMLPHNACIVEFANKRPALLQLHPFYYQKKLKRYAKRKPVVIHNERAENPIVFYPLSEVFSNTESPSDEG